MKGHTWLLLLLSLNLYAAMMIVSPKPKPARRTLQKHRTNHFRPAPRRRIANSRRLNRQHHRIIPGPHRHSARPVPYYHNRRRIVTRPRRLVRRPPAAYHAHHSPHRIGFKPKVFTKGHSTRPMHPPARFLKKNSKPKKNGKPKKRDLFLTTDFTARGKRWNQYMRFSDMKRQMAQQLLNHYQSSESLNTMNNETLQQVYKIYQNDIEQIDKAKSMLMEKLDNIYNNFVNPGRWYY